MFPQKRRINKTLFPDILKKSIFFKGVEISLRVSPQINKTFPSLFSVVISSKVSPKAVERNFLKRRVRSALQSQLDKIKAGYYLIFYINDKNLANLDFLKLKEKILILIKKAKLLNKNV
ncbi:MAG: ribonuclease P protein component [Candidatus Paceibacterota bacterium]|jgi:ribonuclease P protein component